MMDYRQLAAEAADVIERRGWHQGDYTCRTGAVCLWGAIHAAAGRDPDDFEGSSDEARLADQLSDRVGETDHASFSADNSVRWNDAPGRTKEEVLALLRDIANGGGQQ